MAVLGPTASGKSEVALRLAEGIGAELLSVDSMQVYRGMDIGTAKPGPEERRRVVHHMIDVAEPEDAYTVAEFQADARHALGGIESGRTMVLAGGSGLHFRAVVDPLEFPPHDAALREELESLPADETRRRLVEIDPLAGDVVDLANPRRVVRALEVAVASGLTPTMRAARPAAAALRDYRPLHPFAAVGFDPGEGMAGRVRRRLDGMVAAGLLEEVARLSSRLGRTARQAVGYRQLLPVVAGKRSLAEGIDEAFRATMALAKRQRTFFRRDPRIVWLPWSESVDVRLADARRAVEKVAGME